MITRPGSARCAPSFWKKGGAGSAAEMMRATALMGFAMSALQNISGRDLRQLARDGKFADVTAGVALGWVQANLVVLPRAQAFDFLLFCQRNPKPCPLLDVTEGGSPDPQYTAPGADLRTDLPRYRVYREGELVDEPADLLGVWRKDLVGFLL